jgi:polysaccharide deacetylase
MKEYYNQADNRWANHLYTSPTHPQANLKTSGCGPTSAAMIVTNMVKRILPNEMADILKNNGYRANEGTSLEAFNWLGKNYNLEVKRTNNINEAVQCLKDGGMVVASLSPGGLFSTNGHIVVFVEMKDANRIVVYDPYLYSGKFNQLGRQGKVEVNGNEVYCSIDNFQKYAKCQAYFCYRKEKEIKISDLQYKVHLQDIGWTDWKNAGETIGTTGESRRVEAITLKGINGLDVSYRVHMQDKGWSNWVKNSEVAGTTGESRRIEAIEIKCNKNLIAQEHIQDVGWMPISKGKEIYIGTEGKSLRLEAFKIEIE